MIKLDDVSKYFGDTAAVQHVSFEVEEGEIFGLIGTSGCGKTTTLKMINRLEEPTSGSIIINGDSFTRPSPEALRRQMGYVIQDVGLFPHYTVAENIAIVPKLLQWDEQQIVSQKNELLQLMGLNPDLFSDRMPDELSGGQQQRVGLARALAADPPIILMDEPFGALDPITKRDVRSEITTILKRLNKTIVLVTHDVAGAFGMCDRLCLLNAGKVQQVGTPGELLFDPSNEFVESFFADDRFQLELLSVQLSDVLEVSDDSELYWSPPSETAPDLEADAVLYDIIEQMEQLAAEHPTIIHRHEGQVKESLSFSDLLQRFQSHKKRLKGGGADD